MTVSIVWYKFLFLLVSETLVNNVSSDRKALGFKETNVEIRMYSIFILVVSVRSDEVFEMR